MSHASYHADFYAWAQQQAALLRAGQLDQVDIEGVAEEIESMGKAEKRELISRLEVLLLHLLKWHYQPAYRGRSWQLSIKEQRMKLAEHLADNPSLAAQWDDALVTAYRYALVSAERETGLTHFPESLPYSREQVMDQTFLPD